MNPIKAQAFKDYIQSQRPSTLRVVGGKLIDAFFLWGLTNYLLFDTRLSYFNLSIYVFVVREAVISYRLLTIIQSGRQLGLTLTEQLEILKLAFPNKNPARIKQILDFVSGCLIIAGVVWSSWKYFYGIQTVDPFNPFYVVIVLEVFQFLFLGSLM